MEFIFKIYIQSDCQQLCQYYGSLYYIQWLWFYWSNIQHSILILPNQNTDLIYMGLQEYISNNSVEIFDNLQEFSNCFIYWSYSQHQISSFFMSLEESLIQDWHDKNCRKFC